MSNAIIGALCSAAKKTPLFDKVAVLVWVDEYYSSFYIQSFIGTVVSIYDTQLVI
jgi:hypothetical protein